MYSASLASVEVVWLLSNSHPLANIAVYRGSALPKKKRKHGVNSGHYVLMQCLRAAHALCSDQKRQIQCLQCNVCFAGDLQSWNFLWPFLFNSMHTPHHPIWFNLITHHDIFLSWCLLERSNNFWKNPLYNEQEIGNKQTTYKDRSMINKTKKIFNYRKEGPPPPHFI